jgi:hypothetical protein
MTAANGKSSAPPRGGSPNISSAGTPVDPAVLDDEISSEQAGGL